jgi:acyl-CoA synthetase (AMP-forming)/AMP-acid ligase II
MYHSLLSVIRGRVDRDGDRIAIQFLHDGDVDGPSEAVSRGELDRRARSLAALLEDEGAAGERALLLFPTGIEFIVAFPRAAARVVAVPVYPPIRAASIDPCAPGPRTIAARASCSRRRASPARPTASFR